MSKEQLDRNEKDSFLEWRKALATVQENEYVILTPFEKNLEVWRQLWRVVERRWLLAFIIHYFSLYLSDNISKLFSLLFSDVILQIVDARNPLFYWCSDLVCLTDYAFAYLNLF